MNADDFVIPTEGLRKSFGEVQALKSLCLCVPQKSIFAFLGPNGAGKTTTIKLLLGLLKPTSGSGKILAGPQNAIDRRVIEMIELVGLEGKADRPIKGFSGGERQRLGIAQAEVNHPDLLILDEPAASLDLRGRRDVLEVMTRIHKYATIFYCTHILDDAQRVSDQVAIINQGELVTQASIEELLAGTGEVVYSVTLKGDAQSAYNLVRQQPWVSGIEVSQGDEGTTWLVSVTDETAAKDQLISLLVSCGLKVSHFNRKEQNLEDVFLNIIERTQK